MAKTPNSEAESNETVGFVPLLPLGQNAPEAVAELTRLLHETAASVDKTAEDYGLLRLRLRELQIEQARIEWQLRKSDTEFIKKVTELYLSETTYLTTLIKMIHGAELEIHEAEDAIDRLYEVLSKDHSTTIKVIVELDLARYSEIAMDLNLRNGASGVKKLERQIQEWVKQAIRFVGVEVKDALLRTTGDGALLAFDHADQATRFAQHLHESASECNQGRRHQLDQRYFRIGIASGSILLGVATYEKGAEMEIAGMAVAKAVRLEAACRTGEVLVDIGTWALLSDEEKQLYGDEEIVRGKRTELISARRRRVVRAAPWDGRS